MSVFAADELPRAFKSKANGYVLFFFRLAGMPIYIWLCLRVCLLLNPPPPHGGAVRYFFFFLCGCTHHYVLLLT